MEGTPPVQPARIYFPFNGSWGQMKEVWGDLQLAGQPTPHKYTTQPMKSRVVVSPGSRSINRPRGGNGNCPSLGRLEEALVVIRRGNGMHSQCWDPLQIGDVKGQGSTAGKNLEAQIDGPMQRRLSCIGDGA